MRWLPLLVLLPRLAAAALVAGPWAADAGLTAYTETTGRPVVRAGEANPLRAYHGSCTWFVHAVCPFELPTRGQPREYLDRALERGYPIAGMPQPGAVAVWGDGAGGGRGHLAYVTAVEVEPASFDLWDSNWASPPDHRVRWRRHAVDDPKLLGFILPPQPEQPVTARQRFLATFVEGRRGCPPYHERSVREEVLAGWEAAGHPRASVEPLLDFDPWQTGGYFGPPSIDFRPRPPLQHAIRDLSEVETWLASHQPAGRYAADWDAQIARLQGRDWPAGLNCTRGLLQALGVTDGGSLADLLLFLADQPAAVERLMGHLAELTCTLIEPALRSFAADYLVIGEPIASQHAPVISPTMFRRYCLPLYQRLITCARGVGVPVIIWESYGQISPLLPVVLEAGVDAIWIGHAAGSGVDYHRLRQRYGPALGLIGGIDNRWLRGPLERLAPAVERFVTPLLESGRYAPMLDDRVRPNITPQAFAEYRRVMARLLGR
ncbi:MAG: hypothetical protein IT204_02865 [Fimbriimonadaceae bacterium]|nr:hypothetical protein [Fimbriimonadaceae bacterium]